MRKPLAPAGEGETALVVGTRTGSLPERHAAFSEIFEGYRQAVFSLCFHLTGNRADAEDATQETFLAVFRALPRFRGEAKLSTWIYRIAIRAAFRVKAKRPKTEPLERAPEATLAEDPAIEREKAQQLSQALARLSAEHRVVLALFSLEGLSHRQIAETLGIREGTVWSRLHIARKKLVANLRGTER